jgi:acyl-CoA dehydrogenase
MKLSTGDLGVFYDARHHTLATDLAHIGAQLIDAPHDAAAIPDLTRSLGSKHGLYALLLPESLGGFPVGKPEHPTHVDVRALCLVREMLGYTCPVADAIYAVQGLGTYPIVLAGSAAQKASVLPHVIHGDKIGGFALTEPEAGSDVAAMRTVARRDHSSDSYVLDGEKVFISNVGIASHYVVFANADPAAGRKGITAFLVEKGTPGLEEYPIQMPIDHPIGGLRFKGCRVPSSAMLGGVGEGFKLAMRTLDTFRVSVGAAAVGMARRAIDETIKRMKTRVQFGKPLAEQPVVQSRIADMLVKFDASRLLVLRAAHAADTGKDRVSSEAAMAKLFATESAQEIVDMAVQLHGGLGVTSGSVVEQLYREVRPLRIYEGASDIQRLIIGGMAVR